jgi:hypothetical protein
MTWVSKRDDSAGLAKENHIFEPHLAIWMLPKLYTQLIQLSLLFFLDLITFIFFAFPFSAKATRDSASHATGSMEPSNSSNLLRMK